MTLILVPQVCWYDFQNADCQSAKQSSITVTIVCDTQFLPFPGIKILQCNKVGTGLMAIHQACGELQNVMTSNKTMQMKFIEVS